MVDILASGGEVSVQSNEYTLVNDNLYASVNTNQTPEWLLALIDNEVSKSIARGFKDYDLLVQNVINAVNSLDEAEASYITLTGFNTLVDGIVASRLEALTAQYDGVYATKTEVTNLIATSEQASAQNISDLVVSINDSTNAKISNVQTVITNSNSAIAEDIDTLSTTLNGNTATVSQMSESIDGIKASWSVSTNINGHVSGIKLIDSEEAPSKFIVSTEVFEVINPSTGEVLIGTTPAGHPIVSANTLSGVPVNEFTENLENIIIDFNQQNNRDTSPVTSPTVLSNGTTVDHTLNSDGSADISFEWGWFGDEGTFDGFTVFHYQSKVNNTYTFGNDPNNETVHIMPANARSFVLRGVSADSYHYFGVTAYRKVDKDLATNSVINSNTVTPKSAEFPYRPSQQIAFSGDIIGTIDGSSASAVRDNAYNGATFTNTDAGVLAYYDTVSTVHIENLAVNRLKIADESAGILKYSEASDTIYPTVGSDSKNVNDQKNILELRITTPEPSRVLLNVSFQQHYDLLNGESHTSFSLRQGNSILILRGMGLVNDTPSVATCTDIPAGTTTFYLFWAGSEGSRVSNRIVTGYVSLR